MYMEKFGKITVFMQTEYVLKIMCCFYTRVIKLASHSKKFLFW